MRKREMKSGSEDDYKQIQTRERGGAQLRSEVLSQTHKPSPSPPKEKTENKEKTEGKLKRKKGTWLSAIQGHRDCLASKLILIMSLRFIRL